MRQSHCRLTAAHVRAAARPLLETVLPDARPRRGCPTDALFALLLTACCCLCSFAAACRRRRLDCSRETARRAFRDALPEHLLELRRRLVQALHRTLPPKGFRQRRRGYDVAIDLHQRPFYGNRDTAGILGGDEKHGTQYFWTFATVVLLHQGRRWTVALCEVTSGRLEEILPLLLEQLQSAGIRARKLLADRGFHSGPVMRWLKERQLPFVIPLQVRGRRLTKLQQRPTGTRYRYRWRPRRSDYQVQVTVTVLRHRQRRARRKVVVMLLATWGVGQVSARWLREIYRRRFGIETSYRQLGQALAASASTEARVRLLWVGLALVLRNLWVSLHWEVLAERGPGGRRRLQLALLPLLQMLEWLNLALHADLPPVQETQTPNDPSVMDWLC